ncbi:MAG: POTRA domain-containing protein, partial [Chitinophagales bacterium]
MRSIHFLFVCIGFFLSVAVSTRAQSAMVIVDTILITGNEKTNAHIIYRELYFKSGDTVSLNRLQGLIDSSAMNLLNTPLFLEVQIDYVPLNPESISILVTVKERWYIFPVFYIALADRNFNVWWFEQEHKLNRLEYGVGLVYYNTTGNNDVLRLNTVFGYSNKYEVSYNLPYFSPHTNLGGGVGFLFQSNRQIYYTTQNNNQIFFDGEDPVRKKIRAAMRLHMRNEIHYTSAIEMQYHDIQIADTIAALNPDYLGDSRTRLQ